MKPGFLLIFCAALLVSGGGCDFAQKLDGALAKVPWFAAPSHDAEAAAMSVTLTEGLRFQIRPSTLGVTGVVEDALGNDSRVLHVTLRETDPEDSLKIDWRDTSATGTLELSAYAGAQTMLLPAFWPAGRAAVEGNGGVWLSREAYRVLAQGGTADLRLGVAEGTLATVSKALASFSDLSLKLSGSASATNIASPFQMRKTGTSETFPLMIDGKLELVRVMRVTSWFADAFVLDNPQNPLILKVAVHPASQPALKALEPASIRWEELGYEITALFRP